MVCASMHAFRAGAVCVHVLEGLLGLGRAYMHACMWGLREAHALTYQAVVLIGATSYCLFPSTCYCPLHNPSALH